LRFLLDDRLAPITSEIGFLETDHRRAAKGFLDWHAPLQNPLGRMLSRRAVSGTLETVLRALLPLTSVERRRELFVPTASRWTAYFDNGYRGTDAMPVMSYLAKSLGCRGLRVVAVPHTMQGEFSTSRGRYGATILEVYGPEDTDFLNYVRAICAANDGGRWTFSQSGAPLPFERPEFYGHKRIKERFPPELLEQYLHELGLRAFDESFYMPPGSQAEVVEKHGPVFPDSVEYSLEEVRADF
jgi:hypothetical protein